MQSEQPGKKRRTLDDRNKIIGIIIIFAIIALTTIANRAMRLVDKMMVPKVVVTQPAMIPKVSLPNPQQYYFIDCADGELAMIIGKEKVYRYICEDGKWKGSSRL